MTGEKCGLGQRKSVSFQFGKSGLYLSQWSSIQSLRGMSANLLPSLHLTVRRALDSLQLEGSMTFFAKTSE